MAPRILNDNGIRNSTIENSSQPSSYPPMVPMNQRTPPRRINDERHTNSKIGVRGNLHALTIGINNYKSQKYHNLSGCLADADGIDKYLQAVLSVNRKNITSLRDHEATREAILKELVSFITNPNIQRDDPILIYFAGHGSETWSPRGWASNNSKTQMLIPYDCGTKIEGNDVHGIPGRTLGWILKKLADEKGNNITVILDSCFSGSGTRALREFRGVDYFLQLPPNLDDEYTHDVEPISITRAINIAPGFLHGGFKSHVLISACGAQERAREISGHGVFTEALLNALKRWRTHGISLERLTYKDLLGLVGKLPDQNPQCEGDHQNRCIFNSKVPHRPRISYSGSVKSDTLHIDAGSAHGITVGSIMSIWKDLDSYYLDEQPIANVSMHKINLYNSESINSYNPKAKAPRIFSHGSSFVAQHRLPGDRPELRIHPRDHDVASQRMFHAVIREIAEIFMQPMNIILSSIETEASVVISNGREAIHFGFIDPEMSRHGLKYLPHSIPKNKIDLQKVIHAISHHLYHLRFPKIPEDEEVAYFASNVSIQVFKGEVYSEEQPGENLNKDGKGIDLVMDRSPQTIVIKNDTHHDIYPALFYFDSIDLSITPVYLPPTAGQNRVDPPLRANQSLIIGCGTGSGGVPHVFENDGPGYIELGFLKLFIMSKAVDLCNLAQESPFEKVKAEGPPVLAQQSASENTRATATWVPTHTFDFFQTIVVPVVVRSTPRRDQGNAAIQSASNPMSVSGPPSYPNPQPPQFKSMWRETLNVRVNFSIQATPKAPPLRQHTSNLGPTPARLARLAASLENMENDLNAIETAQKEGIEELKELGQKFESLQLKLAGQNAG